MSGIAGIFHRDGRPVDPATLRSMMAAASHRGPDGARSVVDGPIGLCHQALHTTPEAALERLPLRLEPSGLIITFDGRIDNRDELIAHLDGDGASAGRTDAALVLRAFQRWGDACMDRLLGDFAFAIWDPRARRLFCARDPIGVRPFCYYLDGKVFLWASELRQILVHALVPRCVNEGMVAEYLAAFVRESEETLYRDVRRLRPGSILAVDGRTSRASSYWTPRPRSLLEYRSDAEYADHCRELVAKAVACRLRSDRRVAIWLSGGVDSSAIAGTAAHLRPPAGRPSIETFSLVFRDQPPADERRFIADVVAMWRLPSHPVCPATASGPEYARQVERRLDIPDFPNDEQGKPLLSMMRTRGLRVALTGFGGDQGFTGSAYHYADLLRRGRLVRLTRQVRADRLAPERSFGDVLSFGAWPLIPEAIKTLVRPIVRSVRRRPLVPDWIGPDLAHRVCLLDRLHPRGRGRRPMSYAAADVAAEYRSGWTSLVLEIGERQSAEFGIETRHPFLDRRLIDFALALPDDQRRRGTTSKVVLRRAMHAVLPESVRARCDKGDFTHAFVESLEAIGGCAFMDHLAIATLGWVEQARIGQMYRQMVRAYRSGDPRYRQHASPLWMVASIELWFNTVISARQAAFDASRDHRLSASA